MEGSEKAGYAPPREISYPHPPELRPESAQQSQQTNMHLNLPYPHQAHHPPQEELPRSYQNYQNAASYPPLQQHYSGAPSTGPAPAPIPVRYSIDGQLNGHSTNAAMVKPIKQAAGRVGMEDVFRGQLAPSSAEKKIRLRKACDSCSHRKVKVVRPPN